MKKQSVAAFAALTLIAGVGAQEIGIKDFALGGDMRAEAARAGLRCEASRHGGEWCISVSGSYTELGRTIAGVPATRVIFAGYENRLGWIIYTFAQSEFIIVKAAFSEKYPSMKCQDSVVQNRMGAKFDQTECSVTSPTATLNIKRRSSDLTQGSVEVRTADYEQRTKADFERQKGQAKKDI